MTHIFSSYEQKARQEAEAYEMALSTYRLKNDGSVVPYADGEGVEVFNRISSLVASMGAKITNRKLVGIVGNLSVYGADREKVPPLKEMATKLARDLVVKGSAGLAVSDEGVYRLGGFITPVTDANDVDKVLSIFQAQADEDGSWIARIYQDSLVQEWRGLRKLTDLLRYRPKEYSQTVAFLSTYQTDDAGMPLGEMEQLLPVLKGVMAVEARIHRVSEIYGFPTVVLKGNMVDPSGKAPTQVLQVSSDGSVSYLEPADMGNLIRQKKDLISQLDEMAILPAGQRFGSEAPSGEALKEVNASFDSSLIQYASTISGLMTDAYRTCYGDVEIVLSPNRIQDNDEKLDKAISRLEKGLLPVSFVARMIQQVYPGLTEDEAATIVDSYSSRPITFSDLGL